MVFILMDNSILILLIGFGIKYRLIMLVGLVRRIRIIRRLGGCLVRLLFIDFFVSDRKIVMIFFYFEGEVGKERNVGLLGLNLNV